MTLASLLFIVAILILFAFAAIRLLSGMNAQAAAVVAAEKWLRQAAADRGKSPTVPAPREHLTALVQLLDGLYFEIAELRTAASTPQGGASPAPSGSRAEVG